MAQLTLTLVEISVTSGGSSAYPKTGTNVAPSQKKIFFVSLTEERYHLLLSCSYHFAFILPHCFDNCRVCLLMGIVGSHTTSWHNC